jgi:hypothetical protein
VGLQAVAEHLQNIEIYKVTPVENGATGATL